MKQTLTLTLTIVILVLVVLSFNTKEIKEGKVVGSIADSNSYVATTTDATWSEPDGFKLIKTGYGTLGSIIIPASNTGNLVLYDSTSTFNHANYPTTTLAVIPVSATANTYTYDVSFTRGLFAVWNGHAGGVASSTITSR